MTDLRVSMPSMPDPTERDTLPGRSPTGLPPVMAEAPPPAKPVAAIRIGFDLARARIVRQEALIPVILSVALVSVAAFIERRVTSAGAVDRTLAATFTLVVPLLSFAITAQAMGRTRLDDAVWSVARYGVARRDVALGTMAAAAIASATSCAALAAMAVILAGSGASGSMAGDAMTSAWIAALTAAAYTGWFSLGATFGRYGGGRWVPLLADFAIGGTTGIAGALLPRANAACLLGGPAPLHMAQASSSVILGASALVLAGIAGLRCRE